jgi:hypothetical protein
MPQIPMPPPIEGHGPTLYTLHEVERVLREADEPISLNEVKRRLPAKSVKHDKVRMAVDYLGRLGLVVQGTKGVQWTAARSSKLSHAAREGKRL